MITLTLNQEQYEALIAYARAGATTQTQAAVLDNYLRVIEAANGVVRDTIWVQWQEQDQPLPPSTAFPKVWPPELRYRLELITRPIARIDVEAVLRAKARKPVNVLLTRDPGATLGWTPLASFFTQ